MNWSQSRRVYLARDNVCFCLLRARGRILKKIAQQFIERAFDVKKGFKKAKGEPAYWDEVKRSLNLTLTPTAVTELDVLAKEFGYSRSEFVERIARRIIPVGSPSDTSVDTSGNTR